MRSAIILGRRHNSKKWELVLQAIYPEPEVQISELLDKTRSFLANGGVHEEFAEFQCWTSDAGCIRRHTCLTAKEAKEKADAIAKQIAVHEASQKALANAEKKTAPANLPAPEPPAPEPAPKKSRNK